MRRKSLLCLGAILIVLFWLPSCSAPTQPIAAQAMSIAIAQEQRIVTDLSNIAKQKTVDCAVSQVRDAVGDQDPDAAQKAVEKAVSEFDKIGWLLIQHERTKSVLRISQQFVWGQKGIIDILIDKADQKTAFHDTIDDAAATKKPK